MHNFIPNIFIAFFNIQIQIESSVFVQTLSTPYIEDNHVGNHSVVSQHDIFRASCPFLRAQINTVEFGLSSCNISFQLGDLSIFLLSISKTYFISF